MGKTLEKRPDEAAIYRQMWTHETYRRYSPGELCAQTFLEQARPKPGASVLDLGCGTGRGGLMLAVLGGMNVTLIDFADNCLDADILPMLETQAHTLRFLEADLTKPLPVAAEYGFCTDVLEHIPPEKVDAVLNSCLHAAQHCFFQIATEPDVMGALIGHPLHLSVHDYAWWLERFRERDCVIHWSQDLGNACRFYVSAWQDGQAIVDIGVLNVEEERVLENVRQNVAGGWQQVSPHIANDLECMIVGGGPSLNSFVDEIRQKRAEGVKLITLNGAYNWAIENELTPSAQIVVDARPFNARFTRPVVDGCKYLIASQVDPSVFEGLPHDRTFMWHTSADFIRPALEDLTEWYGIPGGSTVLFRAIPLMRLLGYSRFHLYGCDSCLSADGHHAYSQKENDEEMVIPVTVGGRVFRCYPWMISQAQEFVSLIKVFGNEIKLEVHGDGLLAWIVQHGYNLALEETRCKRRLKRPEGKSTPAKMAKDARTPSTSSTSMPTNIGRGSAGSGIARYWLRSR